MLLGVAAFFSPSCKDSLIAQSLTCKVFDYFRELGPIHKPHLYIYRTFAVIYNAKVFYSYQWHTHKPIAIFIILLFTQIQIL